MSSRFDEAHEVLEVWDTEGFKLVRDRLDDEIKTAEGNLKRIQDDMTREAKDGGVDAHQTINQLVYWNGRRDGLMFLSNQIESAKRDKEM